LPPGAYPGCQSVGATAVRPYGLSSFIAGLKSITTKRINALRGTTGMPVWQRNYYEHVIRNDNELNIVREYITANPANWEQDEENPECLRQPRSRFQ